MKTKTPLHTLVVCSIPEPIAALVALGGFVVQKMTDNKVTFPSPYKALSLVTVDISALASAQADLKAKKSDVATRDETKLLVISDLHQLRSYVQIIVSASPEHAATIAAAAGMRLRNQTLRSKSPLAAKPHTVTGEVHLVAKAAAGRVANEWQYSVDGKTWTSAPATASAQTTIGNLQTGVLTYFRHRPVSKAGPADWTAPISVFVT